MATKLKIYNKALLHIGVDPLRALDDRVESRRLLDAAWADNSAVLYCLSLGYWRFALRTIKMEYDTSWTAEFGLKRRFKQPDDLIRTYALCEDEYFETPLLQYEPENGFFYAEWDEFYLRYVSKAPDRGLDMNQWPETFQRMLEYHIAREIAPVKLSQAKMQEIERGFKEAKLEARNIDVMEEPQRFPAARGWVNARRAGLSRSAERRRG